MEDDFAVGTCSFFVKSKYERNVKIRNIDGGDLQRMRSRVNCQSADVRCNPVIIWISEVKT